MLEMAYMGTLLILFASLVLNVESRIPECPDENSISLIHNDAGQGETNSLTCSFRYPPGKLFYYQWFIRSGNKLLFYHLAAQNTSTIIPQTDVEVIGERHSLHNGTGLSTLTLTTTNNQDNIYKCKVILEDHASCEVDTTAITKVCPDKDSIRMTQLSNITRPKGVSDCVCEFRVPAGQLSHYIWKIGGQSTPAYTYPDFDQDERRMLDENGGKSTLRVHVDMYKIENITCQIVLRDGHSCFKTMRLKFEDPNLELMIMDSSDSWGALGSSKQTIACTVYHSAGKPNINMTVISGMNSRLADQRMHNYDNNPHQYTLFAETRSSKPGLVMCNVSDDKGNYSVSRFIIMSVCPEANSITVVQEYRAARPTGLTNLTCHFRVPTAKFYQYSWLLGDEKAFIHGIQSKQTGINPKYSALIRNEEHKLFRNGGKSTITLTADIKRNVTLTCEVILIDTTKCASRALRPQFEDPTILVQIFGSTRGYDQTSVCTVRASLGSPSISLSEDGEEDYKLSTLVTNTDYPSHGVYQHGSVFVDTSQFRSGNLTCLVTDTLGTYHKTIGISREVCPARSMTVDRTTPVTESDKNLHLQCAVQVKTKNFLRLSWMAGSSLSLIYEYNETNEIQHLGKAQTILSSDMITSELDIQPIEINDQAILCAVFFENGYNCLFIYMLEYPEELGISTSKSPFTIIGPIFLVVAAILLVFIAWMLIRRKKSIAYTPLPPESGYEDILTFCRKHGKPYYDQEFEPVKFSLLGGDCKFPGRVFDVDTIIWKRPTEIFDEARMFGEDGPKVEDIQQGQLRDGWLLASMGAVAGQRKTTGCDFEKNFRDRETAKNTYDLSKDGCGVVCIYIWNAGGWKDIIIDDRLPTINNELIFANAPGAVFWVALFEKAFAKLYKSYRHLEAVGPGIDIMSDITGGIVFYKEPDPERTQANRGEGYDETAQEAMLDACRKGYPMTCSTASCPYRKGEEQWGAATEHCFIITGVEKATDDGEGVYVMIKNPSTGEKLDCSCLTGSPILAGANESDKSLKIPYHDFKNVFKNVQICHSSVSVDNKNLVSTFAGKIFDGQIIRERLASDSTAADLDAMAIFPQYKISCKDNAEDKVRMIIGVWQKEHLIRASFVLKYNSLKVYVYQMNPETNVEYAMSKVTLKANGKCIAKFCHYQTHREQGGRLIIYPNTVYVAVISRTHANEEINYELRTFADGPFNIEELKSQN